MSNPTWPVYTFRVNLQTLQRYGWSLPNRTQLAGNETSSEADNQIMTRSTWIPSLFPGVEHIAHKDSYTFTAYGAKAQYLKNMYVKGQPDDILQLVS